MEVKNLCDPAARQEIVDRINKLTPQSPAQWGKMNVGQMLAHLQVPIRLCLGKEKMPRMFIGYIFGPFARKQFYGDKPTRKGLPTDPHFRMKDDMDFEKEKQKLLQLIGEFSEPAIINQVHTFFGKLSKEQWGKGTWKHIDHHLQQFGV
jgi:hypothetical protein